MEEAVPEAFTLPQEVPSPPAGPPAGIRVEVVLDSHRVAGEVRLPAGPRRLVDVLNNLDGPFLVLHDGELRDSHRPDEEPRRFPVIHVQRNAILLAIPRSGAAGHASPFEAVTKVAVPGTIALPGIEVAGNIYLPPGADPLLASLLSSSHFIPVTEATVTPAQGGGEPWQEPVVMVNLARAQVYAPKGGRTG